MRKIRIFTGGALLALLILMQTSCMKGKNAAQSAQPPAAPVAENTAAPATAPASATSSSQTTPRAKMVQTQWLSGADCRVFTGKNFTTPKKDSGTVLAAATVVTMPYKGGKLCVALDADNAKEKHPTLLRFDFSGAGKFGKQSVAIFEHLSIGKSEYSADLKPATFTISLQGRTVPVTVAGWYRQSAKEKRLTLRLSTMVAGSCTFNGKTHAVRVIDGNANLALGDAFTATGGNVEPAKLRQAVKSADILQVDLADGKFADVAENCYGQPIYVDGAWYTVALGAGKTASFTAQSVAGAQGAIETDSTARDGVLSGSKYLLNLSALPPQDTKIPADRYNWFCLEPNPAAAKDRPAVMYAAEQVVAGKLDKTFDVAKDATTRMMIGSLATAGVNVEQQGRNYTFNIKFAKAFGAKGVDTAVPNGMPEKIPFEVVDAKGVVVKQDTFEHG